jgi:hypothetical protein
MNSDRNSEGKIQFQKFEKSADNTANDSTKKYNFLLNENKGLKENNNKLQEKKEELERRLKITKSSKKEKVRCDLME